MLFISYIIDFFFKAVFLNQKFKCLPIIPKINIINCKLKKASLANIFVLLIYGKSLTTINIKVFDNLALKQISLAKKNI